jgi:small subunit ribosomal protein S1
MEERDRSHETGETRLGLRGQEAAGADAQRSVTENEHRKLGGRLATLIDSGDYDYTRPRRGEVREGVILSIGENDMVVDVGAKRDGIVPPKDLELVDEEYVDSLQRGDHIPLVVLKTWGRRDGILVSLNKGLQQQDWLRAQDLLDGGQVVEAEVMDVNRGGVIVSFGRLRGFVPNSHLSSVPPGLRGRRLRAAKSALVGRSLSLVVIEVNQRRRRLVLSERAARRRERQRLLQELAEGQVRTGVVRNLVDFGAFVDLGGLDGLIHISELDWSHVTHPSEVLNVGDEVEVYVLDVDRERRRVGLSRKRMLPDPWDRVTERLREGEVVRGTVTNVASFGAFVDMGEGVEGLIHISEVPGGEAGLTDLEPGSPVSVRVLNVDAEQERIALSLEEVGAPLEAASVIEGSV